MADEYVRICPTVEKLPEEWQVRKLGYFCTKIGTGATPRGGSEVYLKDRVSHAIVRSQHVFDRRFDSAGLAFISEQHARELRNAEIQSGDVLLNITGDGVTFGRACTAPDDVLPACVNQHVAIIRPDRRECNPGYLLSVLTHPATKSYIESFNSGGSRRAITKGHIESFRIPLPPIAQQEAIARVLGDFDAKIELNRRMNETLEAMARALFRSWFVDFDPIRAKLDCRQPAGLDCGTAALFPTAFQNSAIGSIPDGWEVRRLDDVLVLQRGFDLPASERTHGRIPVVAASGPNGCHDKCMVKGPGVTTGRSGVLGRVFFIHEDFWPLNTSLWVKEFKRVSPAYAFHLLQGLDFGTFNSGSAVPTLNRNHVHNLQVVIPPQIIVQAFDSQVLPLMKKQKNNEDESNTLAALRDSLLPKLLSGELSVASAERELEASA